MGVKFANNAYGTLNAGITSSDTSLTLSSGQGARFPTLASGDYFYATLIDTSNNLEIIKVTARSTDVLTIVRGQENTTARSYSIGDRIELRITGGSLEDAANPYDKDSTSTGSFGLPNGTTAQEPAAADSVGHIRYDTDLGVVTFSDGTDWYKIAAQIAQLSSVSGTIFAGATSTLTLTGSGFLASNLVVNFKQTSDSIDADVTVTPTSDTTATVTVPSAVYSSVTAGNAVSIQVTNSDGMSSAAVNTTAVALPSGGTVTTSGGYRYHAFTSSGTFTNTISNLSAQYLVVAGGGGGGTDQGGGGGAGGYIASSTTISSGSHSISIGGGGAGGPASAQRGYNGGNTSFGAIATAIGGGGGGGLSVRNGNTGGSGGGGASAWSTGTKGSGGSGTSGQGNAGGGGVSYQGTDSSGGGGGGGASQAGVDANTLSSDNGGNGGNGSTWLNGTTYAGGGGGGTYQGSTAGVGGSGGGGRGLGPGTSGSASSTNTGVANTGGGGGGGLGNSTVVAGAGGSGIVIIRYQLP